MPKKFWFIIIGLIIIVIVVAFFYFRPKQISDLIPNNPASQVCQKIQQDDIKYLCLATVNNEQKYCQDLDNNPKNICLASFTKDDSFCQKVSSENQQYCYQNFVSTAENPAACDKLNDPQEVSSCYVHFVSTNYFISNLSVINPSMCDKVLKDQPEHDMCLVMTTQNAAVCNPARIDCPAYITKDLSFCPKSTSEEDKNECYHALAMLKGDSAICESIDASEAKDDCYQDYSHLIKDEQFCDKISNSNQKDQCLENIAINIAKQ